MDGSGARVVGGADAAGVAVWAVERVRLEAGDGLRTTVGAAAGLHWWGPGRVGFDLEAGGVLAAGLAVEALAVAAGLELALPDPGYDGMPVVTAYALPAV